MIKSKMVQFVECDGCGRIDSDWFFNANDLKADKSACGWVFSDTGWIYEETASCPQCVQESKNCLICKVNLDR